MNKYTFACEKRVIWESKVKEHVRNCLILTPSPALLTLDYSPTNIAGIALMSFSNFECYFCAYNGPTLESTILHYLTQHLPFKFSFYLRPSCELVIYCSEVLDDQNFVIA